MKSKLDNKLGEMSRKRILSKCYNERKECLNNCGLKWINKENNVDKNMINVSELFTWLLEQVDHWKVMESLNDIQAKIKSHDVTIIGFFYDENSSGAKIFKEVANNYKEYLCGLSKNDHDFDEFIDGIKNSAEQFRGKMMFVIFDVDNDDEMNFLSSSLGIERDQLPSIIFDGIFGEERLLHKPENPFVTVENITKFIEQFYDDGIIKLILEQDLPQDWNEQMVKIVAGDNFSKVVLDTSKHVLVLFYQPDRHLELEMIMNELADEFRNYDDIGFAKLNLQANNLEVATSPTDADISLYKKETNEAIEEYLQGKTNGNFETLGTNRFY
ncbi:protein disulfide-isomerase-like [Aphidius gifuensis]|uniref:protein disulfide-isomerase-like n=1 Tax=Aphidius gifuensis TaxID=684658 RepID=UPI001CDB6469|nr:protein disulfide-isomerase-like [Aphidius gifuensis]